MSSSFASSLNALQIVKNMFLTIISEPTDVGMHRLTLSDSDKQVRDWFVKTTESLGCNVKIDAMGMILFSSSRTYELRPCRKHIRGEARQEIWPSYLCRITS